MARLRRRLDRRVTTGLQVPQIAASAVPSRLGTLVGLLTGVTAGWYLAGGRFDRLAVAWREFWQAANAPDSASQRASDSQQETTGG